MPEVGDHYIGVLPSEDEMTKGNVVALSHDASVNVMGRADTNPILDTRMNQVKFAGNKVSELATNIIAELPYAQYDADGNEYLFPDLCVDYHKHNKMISITEQQISKRGRPVTHKTTADWQICCQWKDGSTSWGEVI